MSEINVFALLNGGLTLSSVCSLHNCTHVTTCCKACFAAILMHDGFSSKLLDPCCIYYINYVCLLCSPQSVPGPHALKVNPWGLLLNPFQLLHSFKGGLYCYFNGLNQWISFLLWCA